MFTCLFIEVSGKPCENNVKKNYDQNVLYNLIDKVIKVIESLLALDKKNKTYVSRHNKYCDLQKLCCTKWYSSQIK